MEANLHVALECLLAAGGDSRLNLDPVTGLNRYGCSPLPRDAVPFGSCTSSSTSSRGFAAARQHHQQILAAVDPATTAFQCAEWIRRQLASQLTLEAEIDIVLSPSGTDVEMLALALAAGDSDRRIVNIVVGPTEVGSGTTLAAACRHYDEQTANGGRVTPGQPVDAQLAARVSVATVELRTVDGEMLDECAIDSAVTDLVVQANKDDAIVLLHIVAHSKTGVHAPSLACADGLQRDYDNVVVVVDAAQGRLSRRGLREVLAKGFLVNFTGSKFYGGPPFSGALLVPKQLHPNVRGLRNLPDGFAAYFSAAEMPRSWTEIRRSLPPTPNYGTILRWVAALAEIEAYYRVPSDARLAVLRFFESTAPRILGDSDSITMLPVFPPLYDDVSQRLLESKTTVFGFWVTPPGTRQPLGKNALKLLHTELNTDRTDNAANNPFFLRSYHIGQPVHLGKGGHILRVALGGPLIIRVAEDESIGQSLAQRLEWLGNQLIGLRKKIAHLAARQAMENQAFPAPGCAADTNLTELPFPNASV